MLFIVKVLSDLAVFTDIYGMHQTAFGNNDTEPYLLNLFVTDRTDYTPKTLPLICQSSIQVIPVHRYMHILYDTNMLFLLYS